MKTLAVIWIALSVWTSATPVDPSAALKTFARYEQGQPPAWVADARAAVFQRSHDPAIRTAREKDLLDFLKSDATPQAKAIAISWLGVIGGQDAIPTIEAAGKSPDLRQPADAAVRRIRGIPAVDESKTTCSASLRGAAALNEALDKASPENADRMLIDALTSGDERKSVAALQAIRKGQGSPALAGMALETTRSLEVSARGRVYAALARRPDAAPALRPHLLQLLRGGDDAGRADAARNIGHVLTPEDVPLLLEIATDTRHAESAAAARDALLSSNNDHVNDALAGELAAGPARRVLVMDLLAARNATSALDAIWNQLGTQPAEVSAAAAKALGTVIPIARLNSTVDKLLAATGDTDRAILGQIVWQTARRHPDPLAASDLLYQASGKTSPPLKEKLLAQAKRLRPKSAPVFSEPALPDDRQALLPDGSEETLYLDSGTAEEATRGTVHIRRTAGKPYQFGGVAQTRNTVDFGAEVSYEITGLDPAGSFLLGIGAWDADAGGRVQSLTVDGEMVLPEFLPLAWHEGKPTHMRLQVPEPAKALADGKITVTVGRVAGPNAVVGEIWLAKRSANPDRKRVLIVTGDDYPAHRWRETGPEFAAILRDDPRLEVTICESPYVLAAPGLDEFDTVFLHFKNYQNRLPLGEAQWKGLESHVNNGGGLVIAHFGCGACQEWNGFVHIAGRVWDPRKRGHDPYGEFLVRIANPDHPVTRGMSDFTTTDELYTCLAGDAPIEVLANATSKADKTAHPMAFVLTPGKGRVFHCPLGHDVGALKSAGARELYLRGTLWTAKLEPHK